MLPRSLLLSSTVVLIAGCQFGAPKKGAYENDPLVLSKKPVEAVPPATPVVQLAGIEPVVPPVPTHLRSAPAVVVRPVATPKAPVVATPAVRTSFTTDGGTRVLLAHAPDLSWLCGILEKQADGHFELRYAAPTLEDRWGGKVRLEDDARLQDFHDGDVVRVEGAAAPLGSAEGWSVWNRPRAYRARTIQLVQRTS